MWQEENIKTNSQSDHFVPVHRVSTTFHRTNDCVLVGDENYVVPLLHNTTILVTNCVGYCSYSAIVHSWVTLYKNILTSTYVLPYWLHLLLRSTFLAESDEVKFSAQ